MGIMATGTTGESIAARHDFCRRIVDERIQVDAFMMKSFVNKVFVGL